MATAPGTPRTTRSCARCYDAARSALPAGDGVVRRAHAHRPRRPGRHRGRPRGASSPASTAPGTRGRCIFPMHEPAGYGAGQRLGPRRRARRPAGGSSALARVDPNARGRGRRGAPLPRRGRARHQAAPALGRLRASRTRRSTRSSRSRPSARAPVLFHAGPRDPAAWGRRSSTSCRRHPRAKHHPRPRGDQRARLDRAGRGRAAEPLLRHRVVAGRRPARALRDGAAGPDPLRERHAVRQRAVPRASRSCAARPRSGSAPTRSRAIAGGVGRAAARGGGAARPRPGAGRRGARRARPRRSSGRRPTWRRVPRGVPRARPDRAALARALALPARSTAIRSPRWSTRADRGDLELLVDGARTATDALYGAMGAQMLAGTPNVR